MKNFFFNFIFIFSLSFSILFSFNAQTQEFKSNLFIEPMATIEVGTAKVNYPSPLTHSSGSSDGLGIGARAGFHFIDYLFAGLDGRLSFLRYNDSAINYDAKAISVNYSALKDRACEGKL